MLNNVWKKHKTTIHLVQYSATVHGNKRNYLGRACKPEYFLQFTPIVVFHNCFNRDINEYILAYSFYSFMKLVY